MPEPNIIEHPLVDCHLTVLRDKRTGAPLFRQSVHRLSTLLAYAATADLNTGDQAIETPMRVIRFLIP